jgi:membrane fusion protein, multidrug efflux system
MRIFGNDFLHGPGLKNYQNRSVQHSNEWFRNPLKEIRMTRLAALLGLCLVFVAGCRSARQHGDGRTAVPVRTIAVARQRLSEPVRTNGFLSSEAEMKLSFKTGGIVDRIRAEEGRRVRAGQVLASLKLDEIQAMADQARNGFDKAERDFQRARNLFRDSVATLEQVQDAETGFNVARANLDIARFNLAHSSIAAPADGRVLKVLVEENELIGPGMPAFLFGTDGSERVVKAGAADRDAVRLAPGDSASVSFDAFPGEVFRSTVRTISGAPDPMSGLFEVELSFPIPAPRNDPRDPTVRRAAHPFVDGLMADVNIFPSRKREAWAVPIEALAEADGDRGAVYTVAADSTAVRVPVAIGFLSGGSAAILSGLESVGSIVTEGAAYLTDGIPVRVIAGP